MMVNGKICKRRIAGGNGNPANEGRECSCVRPSDCPIGQGNGKPPGPEQDIVTERITRLPS
jgi:hypothetical protein